MSKDWEWVISKQFDVHPIKINSALVSAQNRKRLYWTNIGLVQYGLFGNMKCGIKQPKDKGILLKDILESNINFKNYNKKDVFIDYDYIVTVKSEITEKAKKDRKIQRQKTGKDYTKFSDKKFTPRNDSKSNCLTTVLKDNLVFKSHCLTATYYKGINVCHDIPRKQRTAIPVNYENKPDGTKHYKGIKYRKLTPIECERLQTVPDNYTNHVSDTQRYKMLGNGWTIDVICHILKHLNNE